MKMLAGGSPLSCLGVEVEKSSRHLQLLLMRPWDRTHFAKALLTWDFVARSVEYGIEYTLSLVPRPRSKLLFANCILSYGLISRPKKILERAEFERKWNVAEISEQRHFEKMEELGAWGVIDPFRK